MAITTTTISKNVGWAKTDLIYQLEGAFTWLGFHGPQISGIVTGISAYNGGGTVGSSNIDFHEVFAATTSGIGTGASFYVQRGGGSVISIHVNRPGVGYTNGEFLTLSAADIGGSANGATGIGLTVLVAGGASPVGYGSTTTFFDSQISGTYPWGMVRHQIDPNKKFGTTYRGVQANSTTIVSFGSGSGFHPWDTTNTADRGNMDKNRWAGTGSFDVVVYPDHPYNTVNTGIQNLGAYANPGGITVAGSTSYQLDLNLYRSGLDPNFAVFAYKHPTLSSIRMSDNNYGVFFFHNYTTSIWDLDYLFLGGMTIISPDAGNTSTPKITFTTHLQGSAWEQKRCAEWGYSSSTSNTYKSTRYESSIYPQSSIEEISFYTRTANNSTGGDASSQTLNSNTFHNAVIKGLPLCAQMAPCPYYLPDDFVMIDFRINAPSANVQQGDTITISGSEVYTVITASYNQTTTTRGIAFCGRKV